MYIYIYYYYVYYYYVVEGACHEQYTGKTVNFSNRFTEHFTTSKSSAVYCHKQKCSTCNSAKDFKVSYVENYQKRGKYSLSEREFLWNHRIKGTINIQKTLKSWYLYFLIVIILRFILYCVLIITCCGGSWFQIFIPLSSTGTDDVFTKLVCLLLVAKLGRTS